MSSTYYPAQLQFISDVIEWLDGIPMADSDGFMNLKILLTTDDEERTVLGEISKGQDGKLKVDLV